MKLKLLLPILLFITSISTFSCKNSTQPDENADNEDFTFEVTRLGVPGRNNVFCDVWVYDENNIWAAGLLSLRDTADAANIPEYSFTHWDGKKWTGIDARSNEIQGIWGFSDNKLLLADGMVYKFENDSLKRQTIDKNKLVFKFWASSEDNVWGVGPFGGIVHYDGQTWKSIDFDTQWDFFSVTGSKVTGAAYALATNYQQTEIVKLENSTAEVIFSCGPPTSPYYGRTLTLANENELFVGNGSIWKLNLSTRAAQTLFTCSPIAVLISSYAVSPTDIYFYGFNNNASDVMVHYNGKRFKQFALPALSNQPKAIKATSNIAAAVGFTDHQAQIITIKRK